MAQAKTGASIYPATGPEWDNAIRAEEIPRRYNFLGRVRNNARTIIIATLVAIPTLFCIAYILYVSFVWDMASLQVMDAHTQTMHVDLKIISKNIVTLGGNATLPIKFKILGEIEPSQLGTFTLTTSFYKFHPIIATFASAFTTSKNDQVIVVRFRPSQTHLTDDEMLMFQKMYDGNKLWIKLKGDFKWRQKKGMPLVFKYKTGHARFGCEFRYEDLIRNKLDSGTCNH